MSVFAVWIKYGTNGRKWIDSLWPTEDQATARVTQLKNSFICFNVNGEYVVTISPLWMSGAEMRKEKA